MFLVPSLHPNTYLSQFDSYNILCHPQQKIRFIYHLSINPWCIHKSTNIWLPKRKTFRSHPIQPHAAQFLNRLVVMTLVYQRRLLGYYTNGGKGNPTRKACHKNQVAPDLPRFARPKSCGKKNARKRFKKGLGWNSLNSLWICDMIYFVRFFAVFDRCCQLLLLQYVGKFCDFGGGDENQDIWGKKRWDLQMWFELMDF